MLVVIPVALVSLIAYLAFVWKSSDGKTTWSLAGATLDEHYAVRGRSPEGFTGDKACMLLKNRGRQLPVTVRKARTGPKGVYQKEKCGSGAPGAGGRNSPLGFAAAVPCEDDLILKPGESCSLGLRLMTGGAPNGELGLSTEVMCPSREIPPCQLLRRGLRPSMRTPLALTVDQQSWFPKSDSGFKATTSKKAVMTAQETEPDREKLPQVPPATGPPEPDPRTVTDAPATDAPATDTPAPEDTPTVQPGTDESPAPGSPEPGRQEPGDRQGPDERPEPS